MSQPASARREVQETKVDKEEHVEKSSGALDTCGMFPGGSQHAWVLVQEPEMAAVRG